MTDAFGQELRVGDFVGYITGGRHQDTVKGRVVQIKKLVQIEVVQTVGYCSSKPGDKIWIHPHRTTRTLEEFPKVSFTMLDEHGEEVR